MTNTRRQYRPNQFSLIIGAGAHVPYGFPTGERLLKVLKMIHPDYPKSDLDENDKKQLLKYQNRLHEYIEDAYKLDLFDFGYEEEDACKDSIEENLLNFIIAFGESGSQSIDTFLAKYINEHKTDKKMAISGKFLIASIILDFEEDFPIAFSNQDWVHYLINEFFINDHKRETLVASPPNIVTFNYDNYFEKLIYSHLTKYHNATKDEALATIEKLNILHVYGDVGSLRNKKRLNALKYSMESLRVIGEEREDLKELSDKIYKRFDNTRYLYFLGFGFESQNMSVLFGHHQDTWNDLFIEINTTNIGLSDNKMRKIKRDSGLNISFPSGGKKFDSVKLISEVKPIFETRLKSKPVSMIR